MIWFICENRFPDRPVNFNDIKKDEMIIMMKHIVMFKFQAEANGKTAMENAAAAKEKGRTAAGTDSAAEEVGSTAEQSVRRPDQL